MVGWLWPVGLALALAHAQQAAEQVPTATRSVPYKFAVSVTVLDENHPFKVPKMLVRDGGTASMCDVSDSTHVVGLRRVAGQKVPLERTYSEGTKVDVSVVSLDATEVLVELTLELKSVKVDQEADNSADIRVHKVRRHFTKHVALGTRSIAEVGHLKIAVVVDAATRASADSRD